MQHHEKMIHTDALHDHLSPTMFQRPDRVCDPLYVITMISNPVRYRSRWRLYHDFAKRCAAAGAVLYTCEVAFGHREFSITSPDEPRHLQLRTSSELWHKENALNLLLSRLPLDWKYVAWVDADVSFARDDWANETLHQLQHHPVVQMFSEAQDLDPDSQSCGPKQGFAYCYVHGMPRMDEPCYESDGQGRAHFWHTGFAWAARREALDALGGLLDHCILGSADFHMAYSLIGEGLTTLANRREVSSRYKYLIDLWQQRAEKYVRRDLGYVPGLLLHHWHGPKAARRYVDRWQILTESGFDPDLDLKRDWQGLYQLTDRSAQLRDQLRAYFRQRNEDSVDADSVWSATMNKV